MFEKKHYAKLAKFFKDRRAYDETYGDDEVDEMIMFDKLRCEFAQMLAADNPGAFDRARFERECGVVTK